MINNSQSKIKKVLFYTSVSRGFRASLIGHLYEISQVYPVILLAEELDPETKKVLNNKKLFPRLEKIIPVFQYTGPKTNLLKKNRELYRLAKEVVQCYKPDVVIANDIYPFEMYLVRFAKKRGALNINLQAALVGELKERALKMKLVNVHFKFSPALPLSWRLILAKCKKYLGHFLYYWIMPLMVGQMPFRGKSSFIIWEKCISGLRYSDYCVVYLDRDYNILIKDSIPAEKIYILAHPLERKAKEIFEKAYFLSLREKYKSETKIFTMMLTSEQIGIRKADCSLISKEETQKNRMEIVALISKILSEWRIFIKPHPLTRNIEEIKEIYESISQNIEVTESSEPADKYIEISDVIVGLPPASFALFTALLQCPEKIIISLDLNQELLADVYKNFEGIEYIDNKEEFVGILKSIRDNKYQKDYKYYKRRLGQKEFSNSVEMLETLFHKKKLENSN